MIIKDANYYTPNDDGIMGYDDSASIQNAIDVAISKGVNKIVVPRFNRRTKKPVWTITRSISLPSNITVILDNAYLVMADGVYANAFRNGGVYTHKYGEGNIIEEIYGVKDERDHDIVIRGEGFACIDGGNSNGLLERNFEQENLPLNINNNVVYFFNVERFEISNIAVKNQRWWAMNFRDCAYGNISDIYIYATNSVPNQDGIDLMTGCHDITVQRISGQSGDDFVALHGFNQGLTLKEGGKRTLYNHDIPSNIVDVHDIKIKDLIGTSVRQACLALRQNEETNELYNIDVENLIQSNGGDKNNFPYSANIRISTFFKNNKSVKTYMHDVTVKNLITPVHTAFVIDGNMKDFYLENIRQVSGWTPFFISKIKAKNVKVNGLRVGKDVSSEILFTRDDLDETTSVESFEINDVTVDNGKEYTNIPITENMNITIEGEKLC